MTMWATLTVSVTFFAAAAAAHLLLCAFTGGSRFVLKSLLTGFIFLALAAAWEYRSGALDFVSLYLYATAWLAYMIFFINLLNSVTLKMLACLAEAPDGAMEETGFLTIFNEETGINTRLRDMTANGFIKLEDGRLSITGKAGILLETVFLIRKFLSIDAVG